MYCSFQSIKLHQYITLTIAFQCQIYKNLQYGYYHKEGESNTITT